MRWPIRGARSISRRGASPREIDLPARWADYSQLARFAHPLRTETLSAIEIVAFRDQAFQTYHSSERYRAMIRDTFGEVGLAEVARMLAVPLARGMAAP